MKPNWFFEILNKLDEDGFLTQGIGSKSACLTEKGIKYAKELEKRYNITGEFVR